MLEEWEWTWKSVLLVAVGIVLLRVAGRKSISQMSVATTVIMISIGTTIVQPIANNELWKAIGSATIFIASLIAIEYLQLKFNWFEKLMSGKSRVVIENGVIHQQNLRAMRMTVDQLEMRLRQNQVNSIQDVKTATLESNGQIGYELMPYARPVTIGDLERLLKLPLASSQQAALFQEVRQNGNTEHVEPKLQ
ncbi:DUF421 domain-containing protein [Paenibacillus sp. PL2-23]|uniref:DUF421 domain-containing protein n=1 Tax=Paenibacillus sp. PL2-23 TaxID=2100729 RepID=UPI0030F648A6